MFFPDHFFSKLFWVAHAALRDITVPCLRFYSSPLLRCPCGRVASKTRKREGERRKERKMGQAFVQSRASVPLSPFLFFVWPIPVTGLWRCLFSLSLSHGRLSITTKAGFLPFVPRQPQLSVPQLSVKKFGACAHCSFLWKGLFFPSNACPPCFTAKKERRTHISASARDLPFFVDSFCDAFCRRCGPQEKRNTF